MNHRTTNEDKAELGLGKEKTMETSRHKTGHGKSRKVQVEAKRVKCPEGRYNKVRMTVGSRNQERE